MLWLKKMVTLFTIFYHRYLAIFKCIVQCKCIHMAMEQISGTFHLAKLNGMEYFSAL